MAFTANVLVTTGVMNMTLAARVVTKGSPPVSNFTQNVRIFDVTQFSLDVIGGESTYGQLELDICPYSHKDLQTLCGINFGALKIDALVINHHIGRSNLHAVAQLWKCTQKILMSLTKDVELRMLVIRNPVPLEMLWRRYEHKGAITTLKRTLTTLDKHLTDVIGKDCVPAVICTAQLSSGTRWQYGNRSSVGDITPRVRELFPALHDAGMLEITLDI